MKKLSAGEWARSVPCQSECDKSAVKTFSFPIPDHNLVKLMALYETESR